jgi:Family of unknown function (DUF6428)
MTLHELKLAVQQHPGTFPRFVLPDGDFIPAHAHVTEVGHVAKKFIDCGGLLGSRDSVVLQAHVGKDSEHRLSSDRFGKILALGERVVPSDELDVEVEYDCCVVAQYRIAEARAAGEQLDLILARKQTQCLAVERRRTEATDSCCASTSCCFARESN